MKAVRRSLRALAVSGLVLAAGVGAQAGRAPHTDAAGKYVVGYDVATLTNPFFQGMTKGVVDTVAKYPDLTLDNTNANNDANTQTNVVLDLINKHVNALINKHVNALILLETDNVALGRDGWPAGRSADRRQALPVKTRRPREKLARTLRPGCATAKLPPC